MAKLLIPLILALLGTAGGGAAAYFMRPSVEATSHAEPAKEGAHHEADQGHEAEESTSDGHDVEPDYFKIQQQFIVPVIHNGVMKSVVVTSLAIESNEAVRSEVIKKQPKLRDALLRALFDHATLGGFDGNFVQTGPMDLLKSSLTKTARDIIGPEVSAVLILEIGKQDLD